MGDRTAKNALYDGFAQVARALASGRRAEIVDLLAQGERSVEEVAAEIDQSVANTSQHLRVLARSGLVRTRREGNRIFYGLSGTHVAALWTAVREVAADYTADIDRLAAAYLGDRTGLETVTREDLLQRLHDGTVTVLDVRPAAEYRAGHIPSARSVPLSRLHAELAALPADGEIVAYCRGPYCIYADEAVRELRRHGRQASRLEDGFPEWAHADLPVAAGAPDQDDADARTGPATSLRKDT
ncbi:rhodanese-related sulfurtransferase [Streptacidiphilus sp. MAP12-20]|uniref:ArsR/SmtB family transcription factor n=1 Tax=Streptacidiphilus sp. MAP12-20 TaxID=3156299 RepID=UPI0035147B43